MVGSLVKVKGHLTWVKNIAPLTNQIGIVIDFQDGKRCCVLFNEDTCWIWLHDLFILSPTGATR